MYVNESHAMLTDRALPTACSTSERATFLVVIIFPWIYASVWSVVLLKALSASVLFSYGFGQRLYFDHIEFYLFSIDFQH